MYNSCIDGLPTRLIVLPRRSVTSFCAHLTCFVGVSSALRRSLSVDFRHCQTSWDGRWCQTENEAGELHFVCCLLQIWIGWATIPSGA